MRKPPFLPWVLAGLICAGCAGGSGEGKAVDAGSSSSPADSAFTSVNPPGWLRVASVAGQVHSREGKALEGASLALERLVGDHRFRRVAARSGEGGNFRFTGLVPGAYRLSCTRKGKASRELTIWVGEGESRIPSLLLDPSALMEGSVVDSFGEPVEGAHVVARPRGIRPGPGGKADSSKSGAFLLDGLMPGVHRLEVTAPGYAQLVVTSAQAPTRDLKISLTRLFKVEGRVTPVPPGGGAVSVRLAGSSIWPERRVKADRKGGFVFKGIPAGIYDLMADTAHQPWMASLATAGVQVGPRPPDPVTLELRPAQRVSGRVLHNDKPVPNAVVVLGRESLSVLRSRVETDRDGRFSMAALPLGDYQLGIWARGYLPIPEQALTLPTSLPLDLSLSKGATVTGSVMDSAGVPLPGAAIWVVYSQAPIRAGLKEGPGPLPTGELGVMRGPVPPIPPPGALSGRVGSEDGFAAQSSDVSGEDGGFSVAGLWPGKVRIIADLRGFVQKRSPWIDLEEDGAAALAEPLVLRHASILGGRVLDDAGLPVSGVRVQVTGKDDARHLTFTDRQGTYRVDGLAGVVKLAFSQEGYLPAEREADMGEDGWRPRLHVDLVLVKARGRVSGFVLDQRRLPIPGAKVTARRGKHRVKAESNRTGRFLLEGVGEGLLTLSVSQEGFLPLTREKVKAGERVELRLEPSAAVGGQVRDRRTGGPVKGYKVTAAVRPPFNLRQFPGGRFVLDGLPPGKLTLTVTAAGYARTKRKVTVPRPDRPKTIGLTGIVLEMERAGTIRGRVSDIRRRGIKGARVKGGGVEAVTNRKGWFTLEAVPEGNHVVSVAAGEKQIKTDPVVVRAGETAGPLRIEIP